MTKTKNAVVNFRSLCVIGREIKRIWGKVYFGAVPYLDALCTLQDKNDTYGCDSAESIVIYFLGNASMASISAFRLPSATKLMSGL